MEAASQLQLYYTSFEVDSDGGPLPDKVVLEDSANALDSFAWSDESSSTTDWTYALGFFDADTGTDRLLGVFFSVLEATSDLITLALELPVIPTGDSPSDIFHLIQGIRFRSGTKVVRSQVNASHPEVAPVELTALTGVTVNQCVSSVDLCLHYCPICRTLSVYVTGNTCENGSEAACVRWLVVGEDAILNGHLETSTGEWLSVDVDPSLLPLSEVKEHILVTPAYGVTLPIVWADTNNQNSVLHSFFVLRNDDEDSGDVDNYIRIKEITTVGTAVLSQEYTDGDTTIFLENVDGLPGRDFWLFRNAGTTDVRYVTRRAGNTCYIADTSKWQVVTFVNGRHEPVIGQAIGALISGTTATLRAVYLTGGSWEEEDATGIFILSDSSALFEDGEELAQFHVIADSSGAGIWNIRGFDRQTTWEIGDEVLYYPSFDLGYLEPDSTGEFATVEGPQSIISDANATSIGVWSWYGESDEEGWSFFLPASSSAGLFDPGDMYALILRSYILEGIQGSLQRNATIAVKWWS